MKFQLLSFRMKCLRVTIQKHHLLFITLYNVVLAFEYEDEINQF